MKKIRIIFLALIICFALANPILADNDQAEITPCNISGDAVPLTEQTRWYYRDNNGITEKRLWSITYGVWLTDWIPTNYNP